jgi:hypothetical protein
VIGRLLAWEVLRRGSTAKGSRVRLVWAEMRDCRKERDTVEQGKCEAVPVPCPG